MAAGRFLRLFVEIADAWGCYYASAEVVRDYIWSGGKPWGDGSTEVKIVPLRRGEWFGLPPYTPWWSYYGKTYMGLVTDHLPAERTSQSRHGLLFQASDAPEDRDVLSRSSGKTLTAFSPLACRIDDSDPTQHVPNLIRAVRIPAEQIRR